MNKLAIKVIFTTVEESFIAPPRGICAPQIVPLPRVRSYEVEIQSGTKKLD